MMNKLIKILILCFLPSFASSGDISETGWFLKDADGDEKIIIFIIKNINTKIYKFFKTKLLIFLCILKYLYGLIV